MIPLQVDEIRGTINARNPKASIGEPEKNYTFDTVFAPNCKQLDVYNEVARPIVECVLEGYNGNFQPLLVLLIQLINQRLVLRYSMQPKCNTG